MTEHNHVFDSQLICKVCFQCAFDLAREEKEPPQSREEAEAELRTLPSDSHPGGPLSRAERIVLTNIYRTVHDLKIRLLGIRHVLGAVPGAQKIERQYKQALKELDHLSDTIKRRKQGAPLKP